ncbi:cytochrome c peroxidase [Taibaiella chishuiensis]|uniref:Cytochrome c peroxidase n=2 Tax=Taibaiella chishuiensis TaxID=1434707 RepID=A0A2P8D889_9BACT|nr:cytochrome c peroxidase [Taibaiella chishuiensis]
MPGSARAGPAIAPMIRKSVRTFLLIWLPVVLIAFRSLAPDDREGADRVLLLYDRDLQALEQALLHFEADLGTTDTLSWFMDFRACRTAYKRIEYLVGYQFPLIAQRINGPALPEVEAADFHETGQPTGFQVLEEDLFSPGVLRRAPALQKEIKHLIAYTRILKQQQGTFPFTAPLIYDALRLNLYTLAAKGLSGFDSPVAFQSLEEAVTTLETTEAVLNALGPVDAAFRVQLQYGRSLLLAPGVTFDNFDRASFFRRVYQPLLSALYRQQQQQHIASPQVLRAVKTDAESFLAPAAYDPVFFAPPGTRPATPALVALGNALFADNTMSRGGRSCKSCHAPGKAFTDGLKVNRSLQRDEGLMRNTPSLSYAALQPALFYDVRVDFLEQQAHDVLFNKAEMDAALEQAITGFKKNKTMRKAFAAAFPRHPDPFRQEHIIQALAAYQRSLPRFSAPFDRYMAGDSLAMSKQQVAGFNLFMGKAKCGTCHFMPLFNGAVPPFYDRIDSEILGVPGAKDTLNAFVDKDLGAYNHFKNAIKKYAFKTPTVRNAALTAPYMHNGVYDSLEEVIDFYNRGGGAGIGITLRNQTLPADALQLDATEQRALVAFIHALSDQ